MGNAEDEIRCTFCGVDRAHAWKLVAGFGAVVCDGCVKLCRVAEQDIDASIRVVHIRPTKVGPTVLVGSIRRANRRFDEACPFCGQEPDKNRRLFVAESASICNECIALCEEIHEEERRVRGT
jgi:ATP-dependent protease Clp ATPase subunit